MDEKSLTTELYSRDGKKQTPIRANKALKSWSKQATQLDSVFDNVPQAAIIVDAKGLIQRLNPAAVALIGEPDGGLTVEDWPARFGFYLDKDSGTLYPADRLPVARALQGQVIDEGEEIYLRRNGDGQDKWIAMSATPILSPDGLLVGAIVSILDITDRKRMQISREVYLRRMETLYRLSHIIAESGNDPKRIAHSVAILVSEVIGDLCVIASLHPSGQRIEISSFHDTDAMARSLFRKILVASGIEYDSGQGLGAKVIESGKPLLMTSIPAEQLEAVAMPEFKEFIKQVGIESILVVPMIGRSGVLGTISLSRHRDNSPYTAGDQSFLMDIAYRTALALENSLLVDSLRNEIAERHSAERALGVSEERFRSIFESTTLGIKILDLGGNILHCNRSFREMLGYEEAELLGRHFYDFLDPRDVSRGLRLFHDLKISGVPDFRFEHRAISKAGSTLWVKTTFTGVKRGGGDDSLVFIVGIVENVTEQKRIEQDMSELSSRLQNAMELERLRLAQELHDGPMQELYNSIYRIEELRMKVTPQLGSALEKVNHDIQKVLQDLRATAKELRPPTISSFGLEKAIRSHVDDFMEKHPEINVKLSLAQDRQLLPEDIRLALFRILQQSLANVARHAEATEVQVRFTFDAEEASLEVRDNGRGFSVPSNWIQLVRHGHYGLAGSSERVSALKGVFTVESEPGKSTVIRAVIPWQEPADSAPAPDEKS
jgi:PAS domain S-box-containing protein